MLKLAVLKKCGVKKFLCQSLYTLNDTKPYYAPFLLKFLLKFYPQTGIEPALDTCLKIKSYNNVNLHAS